MNVFAAKATKLMTSTCPQGSPKAGAARKTDGPDLALTPGKYKVIFKIAGDAPQQLVFDIAADETWGLLAGPSGVPLPVHLY